MNLITCQKNGNHCGELRLKIAITQIKHLPIEHTMKKCVNTIDFSSTLNFQQFALFGNLSTKVLNNKLSVALGLRSDFNNYNADMFNPLNQVSP